MDDHRNASHVSSRTRAMLSFSVCLGVRTRPGGPKSRRRRAAAIKRFVKQIRSQRPSPHTVRPTRLREPEGSRIWPDEDRHANNGNFVLPIVVCPALCMVRMHCAMLWQCPHSRSTAACIRHVPINVCTQFGIPLKNARLPTCLEKQIWRYHGWCGTSAIKCRPAGNVSPRCCCTSTQLTKWDAKATHNPQSCATSCQGLGPSRSSAARPRPIAFPRRNGGHAPDCLPRPLARNLCTGGFLAIKHPSKSSSG